MDELVAEAKDEQPNSKVVGAVMETPNLLAGIGDLLWLFGP